MTERRPTPLRTAAAPRLAGRCAGLDAGRRDARLAHGQRPLPVPGAGQGTGEARRAKLGVRRPRPGRPRQAKVTISCCAAGPTSSSPAKPLGPAMVEVAPAGPGPGRPPDRRRLRRLLRSRTARPARAWRWPGWPTAWSPARRSWRRGSSAGSDAARRSYPTPTKAPAASPASPPAPSGSSSCGSAIPTTHATIAPALPQLAAFSRRQPLRLTIVTALDKIRAVWLLGAGPSDRPCGLGARSAVRGGWRPATPWSSPVRARPTMRPRAPIASSRPSGPAARWRPAPCLPTPNSARAAGSARTWPQPSPP